MVVPIRLASNILSVELGGELNSGKEFCACVFIK